MSSCSYTVLLINQEQGARNNNEKEKRLTPSEWLLKQSKRHKRRNTLYTAIVLLIALVLIVFAIRAVKVVPVKSDAKDPSSIRMTYLGNITLNKHIRQNNLNSVFAGLQDPLKIVISQQHRF